MESCKKYKILFILKYRHTYSCCTSKHLSSGLFNSAKFVYEMLLSAGYTTNLVEVIDGNEVDKHVYNYKPTHVVIEAFWVTPTKLRELRKLHPNVVWVIRNHSEIPFLANEGNAIEWMDEYLNQRNVVVACNSLRTAKELVTVLHSPNISYLPNYYPIEATSYLAALIDDAFFFKERCRTKGILNVGCFGAIRLLKNQLIQAVAAIKAAQKLQLHLRFHINIDRIEDPTNSVLKNLKALFKANKKSELVGHCWADHETFLKTVKRMDVGMLVSFTETFSIVSADFISQNVPLVTSNQVTWANQDFFADPTSSDDIANKLIKAIEHPATHVNRVLLARYSKEAKHVWLKFFS